MSEFDRYDRQFYEARCDGSLKSARAIVPIILHYFSVKSVIDIGCGIGTWLKVFEENGVPDILGIDGPHIDQNMLIIPAEKFLVADLRNQSDIPGGYDLAVSLEVAEHLPEELSTDFVIRLTAAAPIVLFSAAVPGQPGIEHINTQWQDYWRTIFRDRSYVALDLVRPIIWGRQDVDYWYQQNTIIYCHDTIVAAHSGLPWAFEKTSLNIIHPELYEKIMQEYEQTIKNLSNPSLGNVIRSIPTLAIKTLRQRLQA